MSPEVRASVDVSVVRWVDKVVVTVVPRDETCREVEELAATVLVSRVDARVDDPKMNTAVK